MIRSAPQQTAEERERDLQRIQQLPDMHPAQKAQSIPEDENDDNFDERSMTRASGNVKTQQPGATVISIYNATIHTQTLGASMSTSPKTTPQKEGDTTVQATPRYYNVYNEYMNTNVYMTLNEY
eukprot:6467474-Amphidinium_carterae.1